jgi:hypothetical protein
MMLQALVLSAVAGFSMLGGTPVADAVPVAPALAGLTVQLIGFTGVPIYLPTELPSRSELFAHVVAVQQSSYFVEIDWDSGCDTHQCQFGDVSGFAPTDPDFPVLHGTPQPLADGTPAYFSSVPCGNRCEDDTLVFERAGYRYVVDAKTATLQIVMQIANSMQGPLGSKRGTAS